MILEVKKRHSDLSDRKVTPADVEIIPAGVSLASPAHDPRLTQSMVNADLILRSIGELVYVWELRHDRLQWSGDAVGVLQASSVGQLGTGAAFEKLVRSDDGMSRYDSVFNSDETDTGSGVGFRLHYALETAPGRIIQVEDNGRWFADRSGAPYLVHGSMRVIDAEPLQETTPQHPFLTGILDRDGFKSVLETALVTAKKAGKQTAIIMAGINDLAQINRVYGFDLADEAISIITMRLKGALRLGDEIGRYCGNKIAILLKNCSEDDLEMAAHRFLDIVRDGSIETRLGSIATSLKLGAAMAPRDGHTGTEVLQCAEEALSLVKKRLDLHFLRFSPDLTRHDQRRANQRASDEIIGALNERRIVLAFQPIASAKSRKIEYYEGLVRLRQLDGRISGASQIVPPAERIGLLKYIDLRVIDLAIDELAKDSRSRLSINVDVPSMMNCDWIETLALALFTKRVESSRLIVEITETAMIQDLATTTKVIHQLHDMGVKVALDDFGAGHTSFRTLRNLPIDIVKIDGVFTENLKSSRDDRFFVTTLMSLARHLEMKTVAEWVRDSETADILTDIGVDYLQGDFIGEALLDPPGHASVSNLARPTSRQKTA